MNAPNSPKIDGRPIAFTTVSQAAKIDEDSALSKALLKRELAEAAERREDDTKTSEKTRVRQAATLRTIRNDQLVTSSKETKAALEIARSLGLNATQSKALLKEVDTKTLCDKFTTMATELTPETIEKLINTPELKSLLEKVTFALKSNNPASALGVSQETILTFVGNGSENTASDFAKAIGQAMGMIQQLLGKSAESAALLAKFEATFQELKALEATNMVSHLKDLQSKFEKAQHKAHVLGIFKKIFGAIIAAILAIIGAITGNAGLVAVAVILVTVTFAPKVMDTICEGFARDVLQLKGAAAEAAALTARLMIAVVLTALSGGAGAASVIGQACASVGVFSGSFMLVGGAENIANLTVDAKDGCDIYGGNATDAEKEEADKDAEIVGYVLLALGIVGMVGGGLSSLSTTPAEEAPAVENAGPEAPAADAAPADVEADIEEARDAVVENQQDTTAQETKEANFRRVLKLSHGALAAASGGNSIVDIQIGELMLQMSGVIQSLITTQGALSFTEADIKATNKEMKREETSAQATTNQSINEIKSITIDESIAYQHQIVGATAV